MKILSLSCVFPTPVDPGRGLFVRARLLHLAALADLKVLAPVRRFGWGGLPRRRQDGALEVIHPAWTYPPGTGVITAGFLFLQLLLPVVRLKREFGFELIDSHFAFPEGIAASLLSLAVRTPFAVTLRGCELLHCRYTFRRRAMAWALRRAALVITVSQPLRQLAIELGVPPGRVVAIPNGVDASVFHPRPRMESRRQHGLPLDQPLVLTAGHLIELKGHHIAIEAVRSLVNQGKDIRLVIAGAPPAAGMPSYEPELKQMVTHLRLEDKVRFLGQVSQTSLAELMSAADVFCLASYREGWPNVVHEAMACGTPVVAANVGAVPELIPSRCYGIVTPPRDANALALALQQALGTQWDRPGISAWARSRSWEQVAAELMTRLEPLAVTSRRT